MSQSIFRTKPLAKLLEKGYIKETGKKDLQMNQFIACCGLDCEKCEARLATINNELVIETVKSIGLENHA